MKKLFFTVAMLSFIGTATLSANTFGDDKKGDDKNKKECKKDGACCKGGDKAKCEKDPKACSKDGKGTCCKDHKDDKTKTTTTDKK
jgi:peptidoglycan hydrolase CwlO-like protein